jgi:hypothetical protein
MSRSFHLRDSSAAREMIAVRARFLIRRPRRRSGMSSQTSRRSSWSRLISSEIASRSASCSEKCSTFLAGHKNGEISQPGIPKRLALPSPPPNARLVSLANVVAMLDVGISLGGGEAHESTHRATAIVPTLTKALAM